MNPIKLILNALFACTTLWGGGGGGGGGGGDGAGSGGKDDRPFLDKRLALSLFGGQSLASRQLASAQKIGGARTAVTQKAANRAAAVKKAQRVRSSAATRKVARRQRGPAVRGTEPVVAKRAVSKNVRGVRKIIPRGDTVGERTATIGGARFDNPTVGRGGRV